LGWFDLVWFGFEFGLVWFGLGLVWFGWLVGWLFGWLFGCLVVTDASGQPICPIFKDAAIPPSRVKQACTA
jgi:hypothetical protein